MEIMDRLIDKAKRFLDTNPAVNEIEISDAKGNKVRLVRFTPAPIITYTFPYQYQPEQPQSPY